VPELPRDRRARFEGSYRLTAYESGVLTQTREGADLFEDVVVQTGDAGTTAKWIMGPVQALMKARSETPRSFALRPEALGQLIGLVADGTISDVVARGVLETMAASGRSAVDVVEASGLQQIRDDSVVTGWVEGVMTSFPNEVQRFRKGEARLLGFLVGQVMKSSQGKADPRQVSEVLQFRLNGSD
jgi:aspartyl-tRNA(Asn)/glutamyl-tRNA(Gln) amidotransferase subunit B